MNGHPSAFKIKYMHFIIVNLHPCQEKMKNTLYNYIKQWGDYYHILKTDCQN